MQKTCSNQFFSLQKWHKVWVKRCATSLCGCLCSSFGGFLYAVAYTFATMFTCPVDHHSDIYQKNYLVWHRPLPSKQRRVTFCLSATFWTLGAACKVFSAVTKQREDSFLHDQHINLLCCQKVQGYSMFIFKNHNYTLVGFSKIQQNTKLFKNFLELFSQQFKIRDIHTADLQPLISFIVSFSLPHYTSVINSHTEYNFHWPIKVKIRNTVDIILDFPTMSCWIVLFDSFTVSMTHQQWLNYCIYTVCRSLHIWMKSRHHVWAQCRCHRALCASSALGAGLILVRKVSSVWGTRYFELALLLWPALVSV